MMLSTICNYLKHSNITLCTLKICAAAAQFLLVSHLYRVKKRFIKNLCGVFFTRSFNRIVHSVFIPTIQIKTQ